MVIQTEFRIKGQAYSLLLDTENPDHNYDDENYAEWFVTAEDGRIMEITVWKNMDGSFTHDGIVEAYRNKHDFEDGLLLDKKIIKLWKRE